MQAFITALSRECCLVIDHTVSFARIEQEDYEITVDYNKILEAWSVIPRRKDGEVEQMPIKPLRWENAPEVDGSTDKFHQQLEVSRKFMHNFAMHTPHYFLAYEAAQVPKSTTSKAPKTNRVVATGGRTNRQKKRKASDLDEDEEGWFLE